MQDAAQSAAAVARVEEEDEISAEDAALLASLDVEIAAVHLQVGVAFHALAEEGREVLLPHDRRELRAKGIRSRPLLTQCVTWCAAEGGQGGGG